MTNEQFLILWAASFWIALSIGIIKNRTVFGFLLGAFTGPVGAVVILFFSSTTKKCSWCKNHIAKDALICPYCRKSKRVINGSLKNNKPKVRQKW